MKQELIKPIIKVGNSAGVILPKNWINGEARIELIEKPLDIKNDILEILKPYLQNIEGIYLIGSYARGDYKSNSDIDIFIEFNGSLLTLIEIEMKLKERLRKKVDLLTYNGINHLLKERILKEEIKII